MITNSMHSIWYTSTSAYLPDRPSNFPIFQGSGSKTNKQHFPWSNWIPHLQCSRLQLVAGQFPINLVTCPCKFAHARKKCLDKNYLLVASSMAALSEVKIIFFACVDECPSITRNDWTNTHMSGHAKKDKKRLNCHSLVHPTVQACLLIHFQTVFQMKLTLHEQFDFYEVCTLSSQTERVVFT